MELQKLAISTYHADGSPVVERAWPVRSVKHAIRLADNELGKQPWYGSWRLVKSNGQWAEFRQAANAVQGDYDIEWF